MIDRSIWLHLVSNEDGRIRGSQSISISIHIGWSFSWSPIFLWLDRRQTDHKGKIPISTYMCGYDHTWKKDRSLHFIFWVKRYRSSLIIWSKRPHKSPHKRPLDTIHGCRDSRMGKWKDRSQTYKGDFLGRDKTAGRRGRQGRGQYPYNPGRVLWVLASGVPARLSSRKIKNFLLAAFFRFAQIRRQPSM